MKHCVSCLIYYIKHKTEVVLISSKFRDGPSLDYMNIGNERVPLSGKARSLEVFLDKHLNQFDFAFSWRDLLALCRFQLTYIFINPLISVFTLRDGTTYAYLISEVTRRASVFAIFVESTVVMKYPLWLFWGSNLFRGTFTGNHKVAQGTGS